MSEVTPMNSTDATKRPAKMHPLMPRPLHKRKVIFWLKRMHIWIGVWGALVGILFAWSGFLLNHRTDFRIGGDDQVTESILSVPANGFANEAAFGDYIKSQLNLHSKPSFGTARGSGAKKANAPLKVEFISPSESVSASWERGAKTINIETADRPLIRTLNAMHVGRGKTHLWEFMINAYAFALLFLCFSGMLIWSRLSGGRLAAGGLLTVSFGIILYWATAAA